MTTNAPGDRIDAQPAKAEITRAIAIGAAIIALYLLIQDWGPLTVWLKSPFNGI